MRQYKESRYWVSEVGEVSRYYPEKIYENKRWYKDHYQFWNQHIPEKWKQLKPYIGNHGYYTISACSNNIQKTLLVHRMIAEIYVPGYFEGAHVDHIDNNPLNNHYSNLQWCTKEYNHSKSNKTTFPLYIEWNK